MLCTKQAEIYAPAPSNVTAFIYIIHTLPYTKNCVWKLWCIHYFSEYNYTCYIKAITVEWHVTIGYEYFCLWRQMHQTLHTEKKKSFDKILTDAQFEWKIWLNLTAMQHNWMHICSCRLHNVIPWRTLRWRIALTKLWLVHCARPRLANSTCILYQWFITVSLPL
jgi:hypothetical protein